MEQPFETTCLYTASAIATVLDRLPELYRKDDSNRVVFKFPPDARIPGIARGFLEHSLKLDAYAFSRTIRDLKFALHQH
ncbi:MAG: hypothetical protein COZ05_12000 [Armatimonadetes bacterium CG_4_10_14_3_um_filter_59_10]|nr:MAG: hypothetical protein COZ05_12000 [Armatimonadetes bacterium CG_4_10_14_3_um_filter_59_10]